VAVQTPGKFSGVERRSDFVLNRQEERLGQVLVLTTVRIESTEKPELVLDDWSADINAGVDFRETARRSTCKREILYFAHHTFGGEVCERITANLVTSALGNNVEDTARGAAVFGAVRAGLDFNFLNKLERQVCA